MGLFQIESCFPPCYQNWMSTVQIGGFEGLQICVEREKERYELCLCSLILDLLWFCVEDLRPSIDTQIGNVVFEAELGKVELYGGVRGMEVADFLYLFRGQFGGINVVEGRVDVFTFIEEDTMEGLEAFKQHLDVVDLGHDHRDRSIVDNQIQMIFTYT